MLHLAALLLLIIVLTLKVSSLEWSAQQEKAYRLGRFPKSLTLPVRAYKLLVSMKLQVSITVYVIQSLQQASELE